MSEVGPGLDMEVLGVMEDPHVDYQELEQYLHQYHPGPAHYPEYPQGVYHELQPSKPPYQPSQVNINVSLIVNLHFNIYNNYNLIFLLDSKT